MIFFKLVKNITLFRIITVVVLGILVTSCGIYKPSDARKVPVSAAEKQRKNIEEGRGVAISDVFGKGGSGGTNYQFASSNPMWRATLEILDFLPLSNVDYSGGIITTDWYNEGTAANESIKITVRFLSNEIRADGLKIIIHKKLCGVQQNCSVSKIASQLESELQVAILKRAIIYEKEGFKANRKKRKRKKDLKDKDWN
tara:strand:- start:170 stop:766 length:597 start_codon:yes stop_codon:yes gene_type:complete